MPRAVATCVPSQSPLLPSDKFMSKQMRSALLPVLLLSLIGLPLPAQTLEGAIDMHAHSYPRWRSTID